MNTSQVDRLAVRRDDPSSPAEVLLSEPNDDCFAIRRAMRVVSKRFDLHLLPVRLKTTQFSLLRRLRALGPMASATLADALLVDRTTLARAMEPLLRDGLISKESSRHDGRASKVQLTATGATRLLAAEDCWSEAQHELEAEFGPARAAVLRRELRAMSAGEF